LAQRGLLARRLERALEVVEARDQLAEEGGHGFLARLLAVALRAPPVVLEVRAPAQELVAQLVALLPEHREGVAALGLVRGPDRFDGARPGVLGHVLGGSAAVALGGVERLVLVRFLVAGPAHARISLMASDTARATWSTSETTLAYSMRVEPSTPTPIPDSPPSG